MAAIGPCQLTLTYLGRALVSASRRSVWRRNSDFEDKSMRNVLEEAMNFDEPDPKTCNSPSCYPCQHIRVARLRERIREKSLEIRGREFGLCLDCFRVGRSRHEASACRISH